LAAYGNKSKNVATLKGVEAELRRSSDTESFAAVAPSCSLTSITGMIIIWIGKDEAKRMKKLIAAATLFLGIALSYAQGQVNFNNKVSASGVNARVLDGTGGGATSPPYAAGLVIDAGGTWTYIPGSATTFRTSSAAATGYINPLVVTVPGHDISTSVTLRLFAYLGAATDPAAAAALGEDHSANLTFGISNPVTLTLGGGTILPPDMIGLQGFEVAIPEPSTIALGVLGAAVLLIRRRK
jgi:hypothetical protein